MLCVIELTSSYIDISGMDGPDRVAGKTSVHLGVDLLAVVLSSEWREQQVTIRLDLQERKSWEYRNVASLAVDRKNKWLNTDKLYESPESSKKYRPDI